MEGPPAAVRALMARLDSVRARVPYIAWDTFLDLDPYATPMRIAGVRRCLLSFCIQWGFPENSNALDEF